MLDTRVALFAGPLLAHPTNAVTEVLTPEIVFTPRWLSSTYTPGLEFGGIEPLSCTVPEGCDVGERIPPDRPLLWRITINADPWRNMSENRKSIFVTPDGKNLAFTFILVSSLFPLWGF